MKNRKVCPSCNGSVHIHATKCPYCGSDVSGLEAPAPPPHQTSQPAPFAQAEDAAPPPPYTFTEPAAPEPLYTPVIEEEDPVVEESAAEEVAAVEEQTTSYSSVVPMFLLIPGAFFLLFGLILLLFAHDGVVTLSWNAHYWFVYLAIGAPLLYFGWRFLHRHERSQEA